MFPLTRDLECVFASVPGVQGGTMWGASLARVLGWPDRVRAVNRIQKLSSVNFRFGGS